MRPNTTAVIEGQSNFTGKTTRMTIDINAIDHIIGQLTDLYSDKALAVIREYSTNAWDAHRDAGNPAPVQVTLPSTLKRNFVVEDFGIGLSVHDLDEIFSKYGASTKRDSDDVVGMLGFGCKAALTYADQFWMRVRKDGLETNVNIVKGKTGVGELKYMSAEVPTTEPNGVRVTVPVTDVSEFTRKAKAFYRFWQPGSVLVNGEEPKLSDQEVIWLDAETAVFKQNDPYSPQKDYIVMGNVAYPIAYDRLNVRLNRKLGNGYCFVRWVPIGSVNFPPSREELQYTQRTIQTCVEATKYVAANMAKHLEKSIDQAKTHAEAYQKALDYWPILSPDRYTSYSSGAFKYKGTPIPTGMSHAAPKDKQDKDGHAAWTRLFDFNGYGVAKGVDLQTDVSFKFDYRAPKLVITGFEPDRMTPYRRRKVSAWLAQKGLSENIVMLLTKADTFECPWIEFDKVDWATVDAIKLAKERNTTVKYQQYQYDASVYNKIKSIERTIDEFDGLDVVYYSNGDIREAARGRNTSWNVLQPGEILAYKQDLVLVQLGKGSWAKFEREHEGEFVHVDEWITDEVDRLTAGITDTQRTMLSMDSAERMSLTRLDANELLDPELAKVVRAMDNAKSIEALERKIKALRAIMRWANGGHFSIPDAVSPLDSYPLLRYASDKKIATEYVNSVFKYRTTPADAGTKKGE